MHITDMKPEDFCEALAQTEVAAAQAKMKKATHVAIDANLALEFVRLATALVKTEIEMKRFNEGFGYKKVNDPWALAMDAAQAG